MPILIIVTNIRETDIPSDFLEKLIPACAKATNKPNESIICAIRGDASMHFPDGGTTAPGAMVEVALDKLAPESNLLVTEALSQCFQQELKIKPSRLLITFSDVTPSNVGWHGTTVSVLLQKNALKK